MTPKEKENALRAQARRCAEEITKAMSVKPKPKWNAVCPPYPSQALREGKADGCQPGEICQCYWPHEWAVWSGIMKERGMIFNGEMVRAILDGRKTQTRRVMKAQPESNQLGLLLITDSTKRSDIGKYHWAESNATGNHVRSNLFLCPFGAVGDRIWVRETWAEAGASAPDLKLYRANYPEHVPSIYENVPPAEEIRWTPSIHMPRTASRILLEITDVRVERLNAISEQDAQSEGVHNEVWDQTVVARNYAVIDEFFQFWSKDMPHYVEMNQLYRSSFRSLWESIYGAENWQANPWVWVISFKRVEGGAA